MALGGNKNTAYCHALYTYNQRVTYKRGRYGNKNSKAFYKKSSDASRTRELAYLIKTPASILEALDTEVKKTHL